MASVVTTSTRRSKSFSKPRVCLSVLSGVLLSTAWSSAQTAGASSCLAEEGVFFSCQLQGNDRQIWFDLKGTRYIATSCVGGDCPHRAGLIVFRGNQLLTSKPCANESGSHPWFASEVVRFGSDLDSSHSSTDLIQ